jgi:hypothetical protein
MVYFQTENSNLGKFWSVLRWKMLANCKAMWSILLHFGIFSCRLVSLVVILVFSPRFGMLHQEKSGNPGEHNGNVVINHKPGLQTLAFERIAKMHFRKMDALVKKEAKLLLNAVGEKMC